MTCKGCNKESSLIDNIPCDLCGKSVHNGIMYEYFDGEGDKYLCEKCKQSLVKINVKCGIKEY